MYLPGLHTLHCIFPQLPAMYSAQWEISGTSQIQGEQVAWGLLPAEQLDGKGCSFGFGLIWLFLFPSQSFPILRQSTARPYVSKNWASRLSGTVFSTRMRDPTGNGDVTPQSPRAGMDLHWGHQVSSCPCPSLRPHGRAPIPPNKVVVHVLKNPRGSESQPLLPHQCCH